MKNDREYFCEKNKLLEKVQQRLVKAERRISILLDEKEELEMALNESLRYFTVVKFNKIFRMGWDTLESQNVERDIFSYCRLRNVEIRGDETNEKILSAVNSYPMAVWIDFLEKYYA
jgi:hypothetical protein